MAIDELQNGRYKRLRLLGSGGMGEVFLMEDKRISRQVAIKVMRSESTEPEHAVNQARLFEREAKAIAALEHPHILPLYDFGEEVHDDTTITYMVMPFCADGSLAGWLKQYNRHSHSELQDAANLIGQAAEALQHAHEQNVVHLDVKPSNFLVRSNKKQPQRPTLLLADFGIARSFTTISSSSRTIRGTPTAMAPEQWSGSPVLATDQYALAVMAYEMLAGRPPFTGSMEQLMYRHFSVEPDPPGKFNPLLSDEIDEVLLRALAKKPEARYASITAFATAFEDAIQQLPAETDLDNYETQTSISPATNDNMSQMITITGGEQAPAAVSEPSSPNVSQAENTDALIQEPSTPQELVILSDTASQPPLVLSKTSKQPETIPEKKNADKVTGTRQSQAFRDDAEHNMPTVSVSSTAQPTTEPRQFQPTSKRPPVLSLINTVLLAILVIALIGGGSLYFFIIRPAGNTPAKTGSSTQIATTTAQAQTTPTAVPSPTPQPGLYIADTYNGSMTNQSSNAVQHMSIYLTQKHGSGQLQGSVTFTSAPQVNYELNGTVDLQGNFSFSVKQPAGQKPLVFFGQIQDQGGTYLRGNYCNSDTSTCSALTGYFLAGPGF